MLNCVPSILELNTGLQTILRFERISSSNWPTVVTVDGAYKSFRGGKILNGLTLEVKDGDRIALLGSNGAGKTTLVRSILGFSSTSIVEQITGSDRVQSIYR